MKSAFMLACLFLTGLFFTQNKPDVKHWYEKPAGGTRDNAFPAGNVFPGTIVYSKVKEKLCIENVDAQATIKKTMAGSA